MRIALSLLLVAAFVMPAWADDPAKKAPKVILKSPDGKTAYDLGKLVKKGPVLVRLTCACTGCDQELKYFQKLQNAYNKKGLQTLAVFREKPEAAEQYAVKKGVQFLWLADPQGKLWKTFDAKVMPTNILIEKGGRVVRVIPGCKRGGHNAQVLSQEIATLLRTPVAEIVTKKRKGK